MRITLKKIKTGMRSEYWVKIQNAEAITHLLSIIRSKLKLVN